MPVGPGVIPAPKMLMLTASTEHVAVIEAMAAGVGADPLPQDAPVATVRAKWLRCLIAPGYSLVGPDQEGRGDH